MYNKFNNKSPCQGTKNDFGVQYYIERTTVPSPIANHNKLSFYYQIINAVLSYSSSKYLFYPCLILEHLMILNSAQYF